jgi:hypothetical protein
MRDELRSAYDAHGSLWDAYQQRNADTLPAWAKPSARKPSAPLTLWQKILKALRLTRI